MDTDRILIRDLLVHCIVGTEDRERITRQPVLLNIELTCDLGPAAASDRLGDTVNYVTLKNRVVALVEAGGFQLIERLADRVAAACLEDPRVVSADVTVDKPGALTGARSVAVRITRARRPRA
jgi:FolB domain-containing protein